MNRVESGPEGTNRARRAGSVLFVNRVYPPSHGATGEMLADVAAGLAANGWKVTVVAGDCPGVGRDQVTEDGVRVIRVPGLRFDRGSIVRRALAYLSLYPLLFRAMVRVRDVDVVVTKTDPPLLLFTGGLMSLFRKTPLVHWAQDVYPEIAEELGVIRRGGVLASFLRKASTWALGRHGHVVAVGRCMRDLLVKNRGIAPERITIIPNWPPETVRPVEHEVNTFRKAHCLDGKFVVMYSGNMGLAHPFEAIVDAAERLAGQDPDVVFLFVGDGPRLPWIRAEADRRGLANVRFLPFQPREALAESLGAADLHLVSMQKGTEGLVVPSKAYGIFAASRPCLFLGPRASEVARLIEENDCGEVLPDTNGAELAATIRRWKQNEAERLEAGRRAALLVEGARKDAVAAFLKVIRDASDEKSGENLTEKGIYAPKLHVGAGFTT